MEFTAFKTNVPISFPIFEMFKFYKTLPPATEAIAPPILIPQTAPFNPIPVKAPANYPAQCKNFNSAGILCITSNVTSFISYLTIGPSVFTIFSISVLND